MKNNKLRITLVCVVMACISVFFAGCAKDEYNTNINMNGEAMPYEIASSKALPSCAFISVYNGIDVKSAIGCFVTEEGHMIVDSAIFPTIAGFPHQVVVSVQTSDGEMVSYGGYGGIGAVAEIADLTIDVPDGYTTYKTNLGLKLIKVTPSDSTKFVPVTMADSDMLVVGESLLAVDYLDYLGEQGDKNMRVFSASVGSLGFEFDDVYSDKGYYMMTLSGNFNLINAAGNINIANGAMQMRSASAAVFDSKGALVGYNKYKLVNNGQENAHITHGVGYAVESNAIQVALEAQGVL